MQETKNKIEVILFTTGRFMNVEEIASLCGIGSVGIVKNALQELKNDYEKRGCALYLLEENGKWKLSIKKDYNYLTTKLIAECELERPVQETLAIVAYKSPVLQSEIIKIRGNGGYDHVKFLRENGFITSEKKGRTKLLKLAPKFFDYFDIVEDQMKSKLNDSVKNIEFKEVVDVSDEKPN